MVDPLCAYELSQADLASRRRGGAGSDGACGARVDLAAAAFFTVDFDVAFGFARVADVIVACVVYVAFFATDLAVRVGIVSTALGPRAGFSAAFTVALMVTFVLLVTAGFALRSGLSCLVGLPAGAFAGLVVFVASFDVTGLEADFAAACAALPAVDLVGVISLATLAALVALLGAAALAKPPFSGVAGFAVRATFSALLLVASTGFADVLARVDAAGAVSHRVACFAATWVTFFAAFTFVAVFTVSERVTAVSAG
jgi:hypothetical protein